MGNIQWNTEQFPYSNCQWTNSQNPHILICPFDNTEAYFQTIKTPSDHDIKSYSLRGEYHQCLVSVLAVLPQNLHLYVNCQKGTNYKILIQKIDYRLPDLGSLCFKDGIYIIKQGVNAIKALSLLFDNFQIEQQAIGINNKGKCKYWINSNFFLNTVQSIRVQNQNSSKLMNKQIIENPEQSFIINSMNNNQNFCFINNNSNKIKIQTSSFNNSQIKSKNISKTLQNLFVKILQKMQYQMTKQETQILISAKNTYLRSNITKIITNQNDFIKFNQQLQNPMINHYNYISEHSLQNFQKFVGHLCHILDLKQDHCINIPEKQGIKCKKKINLKKLNNLSLQKDQKQFSSMYYVFKNQKKKQNDQRLNNSKKTLSNKSQSRNKRQSQIKYRYKNHVNISNSKTSLKKKYDNEFKSYFQSKFFVNNDQKAFNSENNKHQNTYLYEASPQFNLLGRPIKQSIYQIHQYQQQNQQNLQQKDQDIYNNQLAEKKFNNFYQNNKIITENMKKENEFSQITFKSTANSFTSNLRNTNSQFILQSRKVSIYGQSNKVIRPQVERQKQKLGSPKSNVSNHNFFNNGKITFTASSPPLNGAILKSKNVLVSSKNSYGQSLDGSPCNSYNLQYLLDSKNRDQILFFHTNHKKHPHINPSVRLTYMKEQSQNRKLFVETRSLNFNFKSLL